MEIQERMSLLRKEMEKAGIDAYIVFTADPHLSEYVGPHDAFRKYLSGFTGSAGTLLALRKEAFLWTDGRYFLQAQRQLEGTGISLMRMGEAGVPSLEEYLEKNLKRKMVLGFDGRTVSLAGGKRLAETAGRNKASISDVDLSQSVWKEGRPAAPENPAWILEEKYAGESRRSKIRRVRQDMKEAGASWQLLCSLDDIAWLLNVRGDDIPCNPVVSSYALVGRRGKVRLYADGKKFSRPVQKELSACVEILPTAQVYEDIRRLRGKIMMDPERANYRLYRLARQAVLRENPETGMKAVKNEAEIRGMEQAHLWDGIALTKFIYWLKKTIREREVTEYEACAKLERLRRENPACLELSFESIGAYNANAAMMHYAPKPEGSASMRSEGLFLIDSGGQYREGTTDVTRTISLGEIPEEWKKYYTLVLKGYLDLAMAKFLHGCTGINLDILARRPLWNLGIDYKCGTGHGVGSCLSVHEAPNSFRWRSRREDGKEPAFEAGMVTSDEPGIYLEGELGIRIESLLLCVEGKTNEYGTFMEFRTLTMAPMDRSAIDPQYLDEEELSFLNRYQREVYEKLKDSLDQEEREWLQRETSPIRR